MGLFSKSSMSKEDRKKVMANIGVIQGLEYIGGYEDKSKKTGMLFFNNGAVEFKAGLKPYLAFATDDVQSFAVEGRDEVVHRVTVTRLVAVGIFAFALKKKAIDKEAYLALVLKDGQEVIFHTDRMSPVELKLKISKFVQC